MQIEVEINAALHGGTDWMPSVRRLHLGGKGANGVDSIHFVLPSEWDGLPVNLVVQWKDGTLPTPVLLGADRIVKVNNTFTGSTEGKWMLMATGEDYTAMSKPTAYDCYEVLDASGNDSVEITPSQYEQFVAVCLQYFNGANAAMQAAQDSQSAAAESEAAAKTSESNAAKDRAAIADAEKNCAASAEAAAASESSAAESERTTAGYLDQAKAITTGCQGWYATGEALAAAVPTGEKGWWAITGETDTIWIWSVATGAWKDSHDMTELADYYTRPQTDALVETAASKRYTIAVPADGWMTDVASTVDEVDGDSTTYYNTVTVEGITADTQLDCIRLAAEYMDNDDAVVAYRTWAELDTQDGAVIFYSKAKPTADFAITALEVR
jgi:hypothetical protein